MCGWKGWMGKKCGRDRVSFLSFGYKGNYDRCLAPFPVIRFGHKTQTLPCPAPRRLTPPGLSFVLIALKSCHTTKAFNPIESRVLTGALKGQPLFTLRQAILRWCRWSSRPSGAVVSCQQGSFHRGSLHCRGESNPLRLSYHRHCCHYRHQSRFQQRPKF